MSEMNAQDLIRIKAAYQLRYGIQMDDWSAVLFTEHQRQFDHMKAQLNQSLKDNQLIREKFKTSVKPVQFDSLLEAFVHGLGRSLAPSLSALVLGILTYVYITTSKDYQDREDFVRRYENVFDYELLIRLGKTETEDGIQYLILQQSKNGKYIFGQSYEFDSKRKLVKVPLQSLK